MLMTSFQVLLKYFQYKGCFTHRSAFIDMNTTLPTCILDNITISIGIIFRDQARTFTLFLLDLTKLLLELYTVHKVLITNYNRSFHYGKSPKTINTLWGKS